MRALKAILPALLLLGLAAPAQAETINVNSLGEGQDSDPADGVCATPGGACSLRAAVGHSGSTTGPDEVVLGPGVHTLTTRVDVVSRDLTIRGAGARSTTIEQTTAGQGVLLLLDSTSQIRDVTLTGGSGMSPGGGLYVGGAGSVLVERVAITNNHLTTNGAGGFGGGLHMEGPGSLTVRSSTVSENSVITSHTSDNLSAFGAGVSHTGGSLTMVNTTIEANRATGTSGAGAYGGGLATSGHTATLRNVTVARNAVRGPRSYGGNLAATQSTPLTVENSIVAYGTAATDPNCHVGGTATLTPAGLNIASSFDCVFGADQSGTDPFLGATAANNGGPTDTFLPASGSPAIDAAIGCPTPAEDQRGFTRPTGVACDIGAVERVPGDGEPFGVDFVSPILSDFVISPRRFRTGRASRRTRSLRRATYFVFHLSEPSLVEFRFERRTAGRRGRNGSCQRPARRNRGRRRCVRWVTVGSLADRLREGTHFTRFNGKVTRGGRGRTLRAGSYRVRVQATDPAGNHSAPVGGRFRIVR